MDKTNRKQCFFLDRDGVIIQNKDTYVKSKLDVEFIPGSLEAIALLAPLPIHIIIISNQSLVGRNELSLKELFDIDKYIVDTIENNGGRIDESFYCIHDRNEGCSCRKPAPGNIIKAIDKYNIDPSISFMIGDWHTDLEAAFRSGLKPVLVKTGRGQSLIDMVGTPIHTLIANSLLDFTNMVTGVKEQ